MKYLHVMALGLCFIGSAGCGGSGVDSNVQKVTVITPEERLKAMLDGAAKDGQSLGSGAPEITDLINQIKQKDAAKGSELEAAAKNLTSTDPSKVKAAAQAVQSKL